MLATLIYPSEPGTKERRFDFWFRYDLPWQEPAEDIYCMMQVVDGNEVPVFFKTRSMCVGDIICVRGRYFICDNVGFVEKDKNYINKWKKLNFSDRILGVKICEELGKV